MATSEEEFKPSDINEIIEVSESEKKDEKKLKRKKILSNVFVFTTLVTSLVAVIAIPLAINKKRKIKRTKSFFDGDFSKKVEAKETETIKDKEYQLEIKSDPKVNIASKVLNDKDNILRSNIAWKQYNLPLIKSSKNINFLNDKASKFYPFWTKIQNNPKEYPGYNLINYYEITSNKITINHTNLLNFLTLYYEDQYKSITDFKEKSKIVKQEISNFNFSNVQNIFNNFTFAYQKDNEVFFKDLKQGYDGIMVNSFLDEVTNHIKAFKTKFQAKNATFEFKEINFSLNISFNSEKTKITEIFFNNKVILKAIIE
ncbi:hypothetical protein MHSN_00945 [Metamycoplasma hyosynoviae]|uniref:Uncharacterized protein n=2 Tax=Metamycoplasma hyosynoviae TaxID=29559 RepID=A0A4P1QFY2_9BACT|nr:hypothetical protein [Metamycoplasma hyosynoviae]ASI53779.1 hypothetical protein MHSN_00945 [Metamycoplasma hyosynoviae]MDD1374918.1 hypothetical protein [Metamycoplasma hyosynoviae]